MQTVEIYRVLEKNCLGAGLSINQSIDQCEHFFFTFFLLSLSLLSLAFSPHKSSSSEN
jgi:hypothetical protein